MQVALLGDQICKWRHMVTNVVSNTSGATQEYLQSLQKAFSPPYTAHLCDLRYLQFDIEKLDFQDVKMYWWVCDFVKLLSISKDGQWSHLCKVGEMLEPRAHHGVAVIDYKTIEKYCIRK